MGIIKTIIKFLICLFFPSLVPLKLICWFSSRYYDIHDYHITKGGDGIPSHFYTYTCHYCKKEFTI